MNRFKLRSKFKPTGDQPQAILKLNNGLKKGYQSQVLLGVTGSGKTFTMANIIAKQQKPTLIISHNKTLAAQLASEFQRFFPDNAVHYFVSYYDYYQPEAYIVRSDTYIEKETEVNEEIDRLRHASTNSLLSRTDVIIVASVSCIYGLGSKEFYNDLSVKLKVNEKISIQDFLKKLVKVQFTRNEIEFQRGTFRVRGDTIEVFPVESSEEIIKIEFYGDKIEKITKTNFLIRRKKEVLDNIVLFPVKHFVTPESTIKKVIKEIESDMEKQITYFKEKNKLIEAQRLEERTKYDLEIMMQVGYCNGIENYSRYLTRRKEGQAPETLIDYFPKDFLLFVDESHMTIPQINGMYNGDKARKENLIEYGFRLPSALDNRPLKFNEFERNIELELKEPNKNLTTLKGFIIDANTNKPIDATFEIIDNEKNEVVATFKNDPNTGEYIIELPAGKNYGIVVKSDSYLFHSENLNIDFSNRNEKNEIKLDIPMKKAEIGAKIVLNNIFFDFGKTTLRSESVAELNNVIKLFNDMPTINVEISGHTDNIGSKETNLRISNDRAKTVVDFLIANGIEKNRLTYKGYGFDQPTDSNDTEEGRQKNRRTEFKIMSK